MYKFNISAPETIFLHGDHMLELNRSCIAAALDLCTKLQFSSIFNIEFSSINLYLYIPLDIFYKHFYDQNVHFVHSIRSFKSEQRLIAIKHFLDVLNNFTGTYDLTDKMQKLSLQALLYLLLYIAYEENIQITAIYYCETVVESSDRKGLSSSASFVVCLAACFLHCKKIERYALSCEKTVYDSRTVINVFTSILIIDANINQKMETIQFILAKDMEYIRVDFIMNSLEAVMATSAEAIDEIYFKSINMRENDSNWPRLVPLIARKGSNLLFAIVRKYSLASKITSDSGSTFIFLH
ncbi:hypothetical protein P5V15_014149 [Pogonomyrmex californicus]